MPKTERELVNTGLVHPQKGLTQTSTHERIPVLMSDPADFETRLSGSVEGTFKLARGYAAEDMRIAQWGPNREDLLSPT